MKIKHITQPFPHGESYEQTSVKMKSFLEDLLINYNGKKVMIIGHRATQYGLEYLIKDISLHDSISDDWKWQPGWKYQLANI